VTRAWVAGSYSDNGYDKIDGPWLGTQAAPLSLRLMQVTHPPPRAIPMTVIRSRRRLHNSTVMGVSPLLNVSEKCLQTSGIFPSDPGSLRRPWRT
jgi:hypothetical protein